MALTSSEQYAVGIDFGGTKTLGALVRPDGSVLAEHKVPTPYNGPELLDTVAGLVGTLETQAGIESIGVGVGAAGLVDRQGILHYGPNVGKVTDVEVRAGVEKRLPGRLVRVDNDNRCATWAEWNFGAGRGAKDMVFVGLGTGIGGGIVTDGHLFRGNNGFAGEMGHMTVEADGVPSICGKVGCWEDYASGRALGRLGREAVEAGNGHRILELAGAVDDIRGEHVTTAAREGNQPALAVVDQWAWWVAVGVANLISLLDPEIVVVGGGMSGESDLYFDATHAYIDQMVFGGANRPTVPVVAAQLGPQAGAIGAAMLVFDELGSVPNQ